MDRFGLLGAAEFIEQRLPDADRCCEVCARNLRAYIAAARAAADDGSRDADALAGAVDFIARRVHEEEQCCHRCGELAHRYIAALKAVRDEGGFTARTEPTAVDRATFD